MNFNRRIGGEMNSYNELLVFIEDIINASKFKESVINTWIYRDSRVVVDFQYKGAKFGIDIHIEKDGKYGLFLVDRNDNIVFFTTKSYRNKVRVARDIQLSNLAIFLLKYIDSVFLKIDDEYQYDVSIVIPVHNREHLIQKCIESINNQTLDKSRYQVIFVDDCSTDKSIETIRNLVDQDVNYVVLERPVGSGNACAPRNEGIKYAKGKYVFFLDSDDYISNNCLQDAFNFSENNESDILYLRIGSDSELKRAIPVKAFANGSQKRANVLQHHLLRCNAVFKFYLRSFLLKKNCLFDPSMPILEDKLFSIMTLSKTNRVSILAEEYYIFITLHGSSHLSGHEIDIGFEPHIHLTGYRWIFISNHTDINKNDLYHAWTMVVLDRVIKMMKRKRYNRLERVNYFSQIVSFINGGYFELEEKHLEEKYHSHIKFILNNDLNGFMGNLH